jgi:DNA-binding NtrC family response regulator
LEEEMNNQGDVLVLDDEPIVCERLAHHLQKNDFSVEAFTESREAIDRLAEKSFDVVVTDLKMKGPTGLEILHYVHAHAVGTQVIIITGYASIDSMREAEYGGVFEFVPKPFSMERLTSLVKKATRKARKEKR